MKRAPNVRIGAKQNSTLIFSPFSSLFLFLENSLRSPFTFYLVQLRWTIYQYHGELDTVTYLSSSIMPSSVDRSPMDFAPTNWCFKTTIIVAERGWISHRKGLMIIPVHLSWAILSFVVRSGARNVNDLWVEGLVGCFFFFSAPLRSGAEKYRFNERWRSPRLTLKPLFWI